MSASHARDLDDELRGQSVKHETNVYQNLNLTLSTSYEPCISSNFNLQVKQ